MREIVTIQIGHYANFVGNHYWNTQEEYFDYGGQTAKTNDIDHDVLYRAGSNAEGVETYTPRVIAYDLKGNFGAMTPYNHLYQANDTSSQQVQWDAKVLKIESERIQKNAYQQELDRMESANNAAASYAREAAIAQLDASVQTWSDFNRIYYHPRSINVITTHYANDDIRPFDAYGIGRQAFDDNEKENDTFDERVRYFIEECDQLQGFQLFCDVDDGFGGFTEGVLHRLREECPKASVLTYTFSGDELAANEKRQTKTQLNRFASLARLTELSSMSVPVYRPTQAMLDASGASRYLHPNASTPSSMFMLMTRIKCLSWYHTSAILSAAIETMSLPLRLKRQSQGTTMTDLISRLDWSVGASLASLSASCPLPLCSQGGSATRQLWDTKGLGTVRFVPPSIQAPVVYDDALVVRGMTPDNQRPWNDLDGDLETRFGDFPGPQYQRYRVDALYPLADTYPRIFDKLLDKDGLVYVEPNLTSTDDLTFPAMSSTSPPGSAQTPASVPMLARLTSDAGLRQMHVDQVDTLKPLMHSKWMEWQQEAGITRDDWKDMMETMITRIDRY